MKEVSNETSSIPNRSQRRMAMKHQGFLKQKRNLALPEWLLLCKEVISKGNEIHQANIDRVDKSVFARFEEIESAKIIQWKEEGYTDKEIKQLREAYALIMIKDKTTWHADKKLARKMLKELRLKLQKRL
jgi:hypothetical protein